MQFNDLPGQVASICPVFKWLSCPVKWHSKTGPFGVQPLFHHLNTRLFRYSDPHCTNHKVSRHCSLSLVATATNKSFISKSLYKEQKGGGVDSRLVVCARTSLLACLCIGT